MISHKIQGPFSSRILRVAAFFLLNFVASLQAHPIPDIPVRTYFSEDGSILVTIEVEPRCLEADPDAAPSLLPPGLAALTPDQLKSLQERTVELIGRTMELTLEPVGRVQPDFSFRFTGKGGGELKSDDETVFLTCEWRTKLASGLTGWKVKSLPSNKLSVVVQNIINGKVHPRMHVLFPGESSYTLDLAQLAKTATDPNSGERVSASGSAADGWSTFATYLRQGFIHVLPDGLDHILFVLGVFLLSRSWKPLLSQVTTFTLAHSVTLALATLGVVHVPSHIVEPIIALSIAAVALENIFRPRYTRWRLLVVFFFGLVHGLGFAGALSDLDLPKSLLAVGLVGFNVGVECAQLAVITMAFIATRWIVDPAQYRRFVVIPGSVLIALCGIILTIERVCGISIFASLLPG